MFFVLAYFWTKSSKIAKKTPAACRRRSFDIAYPVNYILP